RPLDHPSQTGITTATLAVTTSWACWRSVSVPQASSACSLLSLSSAPSAAPPAATFGRDVDRPRVLVWLLPAHVVHLCHLFTPSPRCVCLFACCGSGGAREHGAHRRGVPLLAAVGGRDVAVVQAVGDLTQRVAACALALDAGDHLLRHLRFAAEREAFFTPGGERFSRSLADPPALKLA